MNILYITDRLSKLGGADNHLRQIMTWAVSCGNLVTIATGRIDPGTTAPADSTIVLVRGLSSLTASNAGLEKLDSALGQADLVHVQNVMNPTALEKVTAVDNVIVTIQDHRFFCPGAGKTLPDRNLCTSPMSNDLCTACLPNQTYREDTLRITQQRCQTLGNARFVVLSTYMANELNRIGLPTPNVIPPWVEPSHQPSLPGRGFTIGGRLVRHKDIQTAVKAWRVAGTTHPLRVAGRGPLESELEDAELLGWLSSSKLRVVLRESRALLFPSFWQEPFGLLGIEALAEGTPVVAAATGGMEEWCRIGCLRVPPGDTAAMVSAIRQLASDPEHASALGAAGRQYVKQNFSREIIEPKLAALYQDVASE